MAITPQTIKDQEFQVKFRGYDALEVKAYLELLADEFFELNEQNRKLAEESAVIADEKEVLQREKEDLLQDVRKQHKELESLKNETKRTEGMYTALQQEADALKGLLASSRKETESAKERVESAESLMKSELDTATERLREEREAAEAKRASELEISRELRLEVDKLRHQLQILEEQNRELKNGEADFRATIVAAQNFSDDLKKRSEREARELMERAVADVENYRRQAQEELAFLPLEIEKLYKKRAEVREELKMVLGSYLQDLNIFSKVQEAEREDDLAELFQSIRLPEEDLLDPVDLENINLKLS